MTIKSNQINNHFLVVDDDENTRSALTRLIERQGHSVDDAESLGQAREFFYRRKPQVMIVDVMLPDGNGVELIEELNDQTVKYIVITGHPTLKIAIQALKTQVFDFIEKPVELASIRSTISRALQAAGHFHIPAKQSKVKQVFQDLTGHSRDMVKLRNTISKIAKSDASVLVYGESGSGKEVVARQIHTQSGLTGQFVAVNCGMLTEDVARGEIFGQQVSSEEAARQSHIGFLEQADNGTLLLDEVTEMPVETQVQLLRVLERSFFRRVGGNENIPTNFRIIATTNKDCKTAIEKGKLRRDFYFRLAELTIEVPPLRERENDVSLIADQILKSLNEEYRESKQISYSAKEVLKNYHWPGNVRELRNVLHQAYLFSGHVISSNDIVLNQSADDAETSTPGLLSNMLGKTFWEVEKELIFATLEQQQGDKEKTAQILGISLKTLYNRLHAYS